MHMHVKQQPGDRSNSTMGRTFSLDGDFDTSLLWLERAASISPHFAQGGYARAWAETLAGSGLKGRKHADPAMRLSPLDPLYYGMLGTRAFSHMMLVRTPRRQSGPSARHAHCRCPRADRAGRCAAVAHSIAGDDSRTAHWASDVRA